MSFVAVVVVIVIVDVVVAGAWIWWDYCRLKLNLTDLPNVGDVFKQGE